jgi:hypothetical protein
MRMFRHQRAMPAASVAPLAVERKICRNEIVRSTLRPAIQSSSPGTRSRAGPLIRQLVKFFGAHLRRRRLHHFTLQHPSAPFAHLAADNEDVTAS